MKLPFSKRKNIALLKKKKKNIQKIEETKLYLIIFILYTVHGFFCESFL